ncbi:hypothetical protein VTO42DRAFT_8728 [Malbranchea cinnamomea]
MHPSRMRVNIDHLPFLLRSNPSVQSHNNNYSFFARDYSPPVLDKLCQKSNILLPSLPLTTRPLQVWRLRDRWFQPHSQRYPPPQQGLSMRKIKSKILMGILGEEWENSNRALRRCGIRPPTTVGRCCCSVAVGLSVCPPDGPTGKFWHPSEVMHQSYYGDGGREKNKEKRIKEIKKIQNVRFRGAGKGSDAAAGPHARCSTDRWNSVDDTTGRTSPLASGCMMIGGGKRDVQPGSHQPHRTPTTTTTRRQLGCTATIDRQRETFDKRDHAFSIQMQDPKAGALSRANSTQKPGHISHNTKRKKKSEATLFQSCF